MQEAGRGCERPSLCRLSLRLLSLTANFHVLASVLVWNAVMAPVTLPVPHQRDTRTPPHTPKHAFSLLNTPSRAQLNTRVSSGTRPACPCYLLAEAEDMTAP